MEGEKEWKNRGDWEGGGERELMMEEEEERGQ